MSMRIQLGRLAMHGFTCFSVLSLSITAMNAAASEDAFKTEPTKTDQNIERLNTYASSVLKGRIQNEIDAAFTRQGVNPRNVKSLDELYHIRVGTGRECFYEGERAGRLFDTDISTEERLKNVRQQIDSAAVFVRDFHLATRGQRLGPYHFSEIEVCSAKLVGQDLLLTPSKLMIGMRSGVSRLMVRSSVDLMKTWNAGDALDSSDRAKKLWVALNPVGPVRTGLRSLLDRAGKSLTHEIDQGLQRESAHSIAQHLVRDTLNTDAVKANVCIEPADWVASLDDEAAKKLLQLWQREITDVSLRESIIEAGSLMAEQTAVEGDRNVRVRMNGHLSYGNFHSIRVNALITVGRYQRYIKVTKSNINYDIEFNGIGNGFAIDDIDVHAGIQLSFERALESASFEKAFLEMNKRSNCTKI